MKAIANALTLKLMEHGISMVVAKEIVEEFLAENAELFTTVSGRILAEAPLQQQATFKPGLNPQQQPLVVGDEERATVLHVPAVDAGGLTPRQRSAVDGGVGLCPNCHEPNNDHLPGCSRMSVNGFAPMDPRAVTKDPLPPSA